MSTWHKVMPDYELKLWNEDNFDVTSVPFVKQAYDAKKFAFVSDYVRLYALYSEGGIYLDTDVRVFRPFDEFLIYSFFTSQEYIANSFDPARIDKDGNRVVDGVVRGIALQSGVMGSVAGIPYLKDCLDHYAKLEFNISAKEEFIIVDIIAKLMEKYGYRYTLERQYLSDHNILICEPETFSTNSTYGKNSYSIHLFNGSWGDAPLKNKIRERFPTLFTIVQNLVRLLKGKHRIN